MLFWFRFLWLMKIEQWTLNMMQIAYQGQRRRTETPENDAIKLCRPDSLCQRVNEHDVAVACKKKSKRSDSIQIVNNSEKEMKMKVFRVIRLSFSVYIEHRAQANLITQKENSLNYALETQWTQLGFDLLLLSPHTHTHARAHPSRSKASHMPDFPKLYHLLIF